MQLKRTVSDNNTESSSTMLMTMLFDVKIIASLSGNATINAQNSRPTRIDVSNDILVANIAPFALPAPSSFATRTLFE
ncbi:hypothetical protein Hanom_Chr05g00474861 [Helianthus anomalus]